MRKSSIAALGLTAVLAMAVPSFAVGIPDVGASVDAGANAVRPAPFNLSADTVMPQKVGLGNAAVVSRLVAAPAVIGAVDVAPQAEGAQLAAAPLAAAPVASTPIIGAIDAMILPQAEGAAAAGAGVGGAAGAGAGLATGLIAAGVVATAVGVTVAVSSDNSP